MLLLDAILPTSSLPTIAWRSLVAPNSAGGAGDTITVVPPRISCTSSARSAMPSRPKRNAPSMPGEPAAIASAAPPGTAIARPASRARSAPSAAPRHSRGSTADTAPRRSARGIWPHIGGTACPTRSRTTRRAAPGCAAEPGIRSSTVRCRACAPLGAAALAHQRHRRAPRCAPPSAISTASIGRLARPAA